MPATIHTRLEDGRPICIRRMVETDEQRLRIGIARLSERSRYLRFFSGAASPPDTVIDRLLDADGHDHLAWAAIDTGIPEHPGIGAVHAIRDEANADVAEFAIAVMDDYHSLGVGRLLAATLLLDAAKQGIDAFSAIIMAENRRAIAFVRSLGAEPSRRNIDTVEYRLDIEVAIARLQKATEPVGLADVFRAYDEAVTPSENRSAS